MHDVEEQIEQWRNALQASEAFGMSDIDELEGHLREEMERLRPLGLSPTESFLIASHRLGETRSLEREYQKVNARRRPLRHLSWMLFGVLVYFAGGYIAGAVFRGGKTLVFQLLAGSVWGTLHALIGIVSEVAPPVALLLIGWVVLLGGFWARLGVRLRPRSQCRKAGLLVTLAALICVLIGLGLLFRTAVAMHVGQHGFDQMMLACRYAGLGCAIVVPVLAATFLILLRNGEKRCRATLH
ncbi:MAG: hypothetical protein KBE65_11220 [Phycisphaerae bacterium]|nr:hypothetical protein [Phycisphaerae bacterium]